LPRIKFQQVPQFEANSFFNERTGNVVENKGSLWKTWERSWNFYENKGTYPVKAGTP
jgi:hypothetical protein